MRHSIVGSLVGIAFAGSTFAGDLIDDPVPADLSSIVAPEPDPVTAELVRREEAIRRAWRRTLVAEVSVDFRETPLREAIRVLAEKCGIPVKADDAVFDDATVEPDAPVTLKLHRVGARVAWDELLEPFELLIVAPTVATGEASIVTEGSCEWPNRTVAYPVGDLTWTVRDDDRAFHEPMKLVDLIVNTTSGPWFDLDGVGGTITSYDAGGLHVLVVRQTPSVHEEIEDLLHRLRHLRGELRFPDVTKPSPAEPADATPPATGALELDP